MEALIAFLWRLVAAILMSLSMMQPVEWCDSCGELCASSELVTVYYGEHYHGAICDDCREYWEVG